MVECPKCRRLLLKGGGAVSHMKFCGRDFAADFWAGLDKTGECWEFKGCTDEQGYGRYAMLKNGRHRSERAHRYAYQLATGESPKGKLVCHTCDNRICCRPEHLFLGTHQDNRDDAVAKGRHAHGERVKRNKLTADQVRIVRREYRKNGKHRGADSNSDELAQRFGVNRGTITNIICGRSWKGTQ